MSLTEEWKQQEARARAEATTQDTGAGARRASTRQRAHRPIMRDGMIDPRDADFMVAFSVADMNEPRSYTEAMAGPDAVAWKKAMDEEMTALHDNHTYQLVPLAPDRTAISNKWVYKIKLDKNGQLERYKARLVAKGFLQKEGIDYHEIFAPVLKYKSLRIVLALVCTMDYEIVQMDVHTAFLNATIKEQVYMKQPEGYQQGGQNTVCLLLKT